MADITNRSRLCVTVKNRDDLTQHFSFNKLDDVEAYIATLRAQRLKPRVEQLDESWLVRIREKGHKALTATFKTRTDAERFIARTAEERSRGLFVDYTASLKVSLAELIVRYLLEEAPKHKSHQVLAYSLEGWLADSGSAGLELLKKYREQLRQQGLPVREGKFQMRRSSDELAWIHKPLSEITTVDIENFIGDRLEAVEPSTVDREIDRLKSIFKVAIVVWDYPLAKNPMDAVRRPKYFNERDRRISDDEERRLLEAFATLDFERAVEARLSELANAALADQVFSSNSARKKVLAPVRAKLLPLARETAEVVPYLQVFYLFQVMTAARRGETLGLPWQHIDFDAKTAFLPETKNGRPRKLALREDLLELLRDLPRGTQRVFDMGVDYVVGAWSKACAIAGITDLRIHDARHEALSRLAESGKFTLPELQVFSGHRDLRMLMRYAHLCSSRLARKLDECFKDSAKFRVHRGRKVLNKAADVPLSEVTTLADAADEAPSVPAPAVEATPPPSCSPDAQSEAGLIAKEVPVVTASAPVASASTASSEVGARVIAFPASRIVRDATGESVASRPRSEGAPQAPRAG
ncbi:site-specific integrase [Derxia lacustris]|uniref:site-specific integrase n=1 Tax=Derxia lacustris TaxID=764842 RepID=UPI000A176E41|nr:site-specific integrase [Derxia lacustris]